MKMKLLSTYASALMAIVATVAMTACNKPVDTDPVKTSVEGVSLDHETLTFVLGTTGTQQLTATVLPLDAYNKLVEWSTSDDKVAVVDPATGEVSAVGCGTADITATSMDGGHTASCKVSVNIVGTTPGVPEALTWTIADGTLTITGEGEILGFEFNADTPWDPYKDFFDKVVIGEGITILGGSLFYEHTGLESVVLPETVETIWDYVFFGCSALEDFELPPYLNLFGWGVFGGCSSLENVVIPDNVQSIGSNMFRQCTSLKSVTLPGSLTIIEDMAFSECSALESITIPGGVTTIRSRAFNLCTALKNVTVLATTPPELLQDAALSFNADGDTLHVPAGYLNDYKESNWNDYFDNIVEI